MALDLKKMFENYKPESSALPQGHESRFEAKLDKAFTQNASEEIAVKGKKIRTSTPWLKIAATVAILIAVSFFGYQQLGNPALESITDNNNAVVGTDSEKIKNNDIPKLTLADISPDLKRVEEYYMTGINVQLASLNIDSENKDLVDGYMQRLAELDTEYSSLNIELTKVGPTETTVTALVDNLKLRLDLLFKLKNKLKELKTQNNEDFKAIQS